MLLWTAAGCQHGATQSTRTLSMNADALTAAVDRRPVKLATRLVVPPLRRAAQDGRRAPRQASSVLPAPAAKQKAAPTAPTAALLSARRPTHGTAAPSDAAAHVHDLDVLLDRFAAVSVASTGASKAPAGQFAYLQTRTTPDQATYDVYDLVAVDYAALRHNDYYTISGEGITHYFKGTAEFMTVARWTEERARYRRLMAIPFFRRYAKWKPLTVWRREITAARNRSLARLLDTRLFMMDPVLRGALLAVQSECLHVVQVAALTADPACQPYQLRDYVQQQHERAETVVRGGLDQLQSATLAIVEAACNETLDMSADSVRKNMAGIRHQNTRFTYTEQAARRNASRRLRRFVSLTDYMVIGAVYEMAQYSARSLLATVHKHCAPADILLTADQVEQARRGPKLSDLLRHDAHVHAGAKVVATATAPGATKVNVPPTQTPPPLFTITVQLGGDDHQLAVSPGTGEFIASIEQLFAAFMDTVRQLPLNFGRVSCIDEATQREVSGRISGDAIVECIGQDETYTSCLLYIKATVRGVMAHAMSTIVGSMTVFAAMYASNALLDLKWLAPPLAEDVVDSAVKYFERGLTEFVEQRESITAIADAVQVKNMAVDLRQLKRTLAPSPERCIAQLCRLLPDVARGLCTDLLDRINQSANILRSEPSSIEDMAALLDHLDQLQENFHAIEKRCEHVQVCYSLIERYKVTIPPTDLAHYQTLDPTMKRLKELLASSLDSRIDKVHALSAQIDRAFVDLASRAVALRNRVQDPVILDTSSKPSDALRVTEELFIDLERLEATSRALTQVQLHFDLTVTSNVDVVEAARELRERQTFWQNEQRNLAAANTISSGTNVVSAAAALAPDVKDAAPLDSP